MESPRVISSTVQEFRGKRYYLCGYYYQNNGERLHRTVVESQGEAIPEDSHVHHRDGDRSNNAPSNLEILERGAHLSLHAKANPTEFSPQAREAANEWHGSTAGLEWHTKHGISWWEKQRKLTTHKTCVQCGKVYETFEHCAKRSKFCHQNCKATALRARRKAQAA